MAYITMIVETLELNPSIASLGEFWW